MSAGDRRPGRGQIGGHRRSGRKPMRQKTWQGADRLMRPGDRRPGRGLRAQWTHAQETEDLAGGRQGAEGAVDMSPGHRRPGKGADRGLTWQGADRGLT